MISTKKCKMTHDELITKWKPLFTDENGNSTLTYLEVPETWYPLIDTLCGQIHNHLSKSESYELFYAVQIKEKFGGLRFYINCYDAVVEGMVKMAEAYSYHIK